MTTQTISAISTPSRRAVALGATVALTVAALLVGAIAGVAAAAWWQSRTAATTTTTALVVPRTGLDPATRQYGARAALIEAAPALAATGAAVVAARPALDPAAFRYGARAAQLEAAPALPATGAVVRTPVDPENRYYGRTRLVRPPSPDVAPLVAGAQASTPELHFYGARSES